MSKRQQQKRNTFETARTRAICQDLLLEFHLQDGASVYVYTATLQLLGQISSICQARLEAKVVKTSGRFLLYAYQDQEILQGY